MPTKPSATTDARRNSTLPPTESTAAQTFALPSIDFPGRTMLRVDEVAKRLGVTGQHVIDLIVEGKLNAADMRGKGAIRALYRVPLEAYRDYITLSLTSAEDRARLMRELPRETLLQLQEELKAMLAESAA